MVRICDCHILFSSGQYFCRLYSLNLFHKCFFIYLTNRNPGFSYNYLLLIYHVNFINVGEALKEGGKADEAIAVMKWGAAKFPDILMLWNGLGEAYLQKGNKAEAKSCFQIVLKKGPDNPRAKDGLSKCG